ncbi:C40 family peptidase [Mycolicibacterium goodii]|uniref:C40 family peptidase n=1 Tax=Mycolicibacterium goodii TaxID=134601 RepID=UPI001BDD2865|nr:NlpC/P60 family protein [Mycolicibacterium goodii]MBU8820335.1 C40 family peptidase [Mycolicibacterium goodii]
MDGFVDSSNGHAANAQTHGKGTVSNSLSGARDIVDGDRKSASAFPKNGGESGSGGGGASGSSGGGKGAAVGVGSPLDPFKSNMPVPGMANAPMQAASGFAQPLQGALSSAQSLPQQFLSPLSAMLGGGGLPSGSGLPGGSVTPMAAVGSTQEGGVSGDLKSRLSSFVSQTSGVVDYAWGGGHGSSPGPSQGISDRGGAADAHGDYNKIGVDCSGYTRWAYAQVTGNDVLGSSTSQTQFAGGTAVSTPRPMDLAFPPSAFSSGGGPTHVQLYIGDGMVAEAPQSGEKIRVRPVTEGTVFRRYLSEAA